MNASVIDKNIGFSVSSKELSLTVIGSYLGSQTDFSNRVLQRHNSRTVLKHRANLHIARLPQSSCAAFPPLPVPRSKVWIGAAALNSAYSGRGALWVVQHYASSSSTNILPFVNGLNNAMEKEMPGTAFGGYLNYVDPGLSAQEAHALYYSKEVYARLTGIKKVVDPGNVFSNPQGVGI